MYFRFAAALMLVVLVSMAGVWLEKQTLELRRTVSLQYYQTDVLLDILVRLRLETQQLTAPAQMAAMDLSQRRATPEQAQSNRPHARRNERTADSENAQAERLPLLRFQEPFNPNGID